MTEAPATVKAAIVVTLDVSALSPQFAAAQIAEVMKKIDPPSLPYTDGMARVAVAQHAIELINFLDEE